MKTFGKKNLLITGLTKNGYSLPDNRLTGDLPLKEQIATCQYCFVFPNAHGSNAFAPANSSEHIHWVVCPFR